MKSPFPGMDPYLEGRWSDVHTRLATYTTDILNPRLPRGLIARTEERVGIEAGSGEWLLVRPDVGISRTPGIEDHGGTVTESLATFKLVALAEPLMERFVEIITGAGRKLVTVIEFISPTNKAGGREDFVEKRASLLSGGVNFVEIDLTRAGDWRKLLLPQRCPAEAVSTYRYTTRIPQESSVAYLQPISLRHPLPIVPIPLREGESPIDLPLQELIEQVYAKGKYDEEDLYAQSLDPALDEADAAWVRSLLVAAGKISAQRI
jgi:hypothetical protein